jgi:hypothetical protein
MPTGYPITLQSCTAEIEHEIGGKLGTPVELRELVDRAGHHLVGMAPWKWLEGRQARVRSRLPITITDALWTEATKRITKVNAFTNYTWLEGDTYEYTGGAGGVLGTYEIAAKVGASAITLASSVGAAADALTDNDGLLANDQVALPSDFDIQRVTAYSTVGGVRGGLGLGSGQDLLDLRWTGSRWTAHYWGLLNHVRSLADGRTIPRLDLAPGSFDGTEEFVIFYRAGWATPETDGAPMPLPMSGWLNALYMEVLKAFTRAQEDAGPSLMERLALVKAGPFFADALVRDQTMSPMVGTTYNGGGWMQGQRWRNGGWFDRSSPLLPSA